MRRASKPGVTKKTPQARVCSFPEETRQQRSEQLVLIFQLATAAQHNLKPLGLPASDAISSGV